jgi:transcriptional regulator with PAS, ATPase and Fis domain
VRVVAATNVNIQEAIEHGKFREDLYYRLNSVPIIVPPLRDRKEDINMLFRKFAADFAEKYRMPVIQLSEESKRLLESFRWPGNIRQLKNITEQISIIEEDRLVTAETLKRYLPSFAGGDLPVLYKGQARDPGISERDLLYKVLFDMKKDINDLKTVVAGIIQSESHPMNEIETDSKIKNLDVFSTKIQTLKEDFESKDVYPEDFDEMIEESEVIEESLSLQKKEIDMIRKALDKYNGKRKNAAQELGISERTLYRKIKEYDLDK